MREISLQILQKQKGNEKSAPLIKFIGTEDMFKDKMVSMPVFYEITSPIYIC